MGWIGSAVQERRDKDGDGEGGICRGRGVERFGLEGVLCVGEGKGD